MRRGAVSLLAVNDMVIGVVIEVDITVEEVEKELVLVVKVVEKVLRLIDF
jgi:hypothetical protein